MKCNYPYNIDIEKQYEKMGINVKGKTKNDELFYDVELPKKWLLKITQHCMWTELFDEKDRKRAKIFYKAAFYDRESFINLENKINFEVDRLLFLNKDYSINNKAEYNGYYSPYVGRVTDFDGTVLFETEHVKCDVEYNIDLHKRGYIENYKQQSIQIKKDLKEKCLNYLANNYPDYENVNAYWN